MFLLPCTRQSLDCTFIFLYHFYWVILTFKPQKISCFVVILECNVYILTHFFHIIAYTDTLAVCVLLFLSDEWEKSVHCRWIFVGRCIDCSDTAQQWRHMTQSQLRAGITNRKWRVGWAAKLEQRHTHSLLLTHIQMAKDTADYCYMLTSECFIHLGNTGLHWIKNSLTLLKGFVCYN